jgi:hypothetical protein
VLQWLVWLCGCVDGLVELRAGALDGLLAAEDVRVGVLDSVGDVVLRGGAGMPTAAAVVVLGGACGARG